jgi:hypothetical protein
MDLLERWFLRLKRDAIAAFCLVSYWEVIRIALQLSFEAERILEIHQF